MKKIEEFIDKFFKYDRLTTFILGSGILSLLTSAFQSVLALPPNVPLFILGSFLVIVSIVNTWLLRRIAVNRAQDESPPINEDMEKTDSQNYAEIREYLKNRVLPLVESSSRLLQDCRRPFSDEYFMNFACTREVHELYSVKENVNNFIDFVDAQIKFSRRRMMVAVRNSYEALYIAMILARLISKSDQEPDAAEKTASVLARWDEVRELLTKIERKRQWRDLEAELDTVRLHVKMSFDITG